MPITKQDFARATPLLLLVALAALLVIVGGTAWLVERTQERFAAIVEARAVRTTAVELRNALQDTESGQRGYLLTGEPQYLEPYEAAFGVVEPALARLEAALSGWPELTARLPALRENTLNKLGEVGETVELTRAGRRGEAMAIVETDRGKRYMDAARDLLDAVIAAADDRLSAAVEQQREGTVLLRWVAILGAALIVAVVGGAAAAGLVYTRELAGMRRVLETANVRLEERVAERTAALERANEEVQRFAYIVTHDLRAPLVNIMGFTSEMEAALEPLRGLLEQDEPDAQAREAVRLAVAEDIPEAIGFIRSSTGKMDGLINAILKISRDGRRPLRPEPVDLAQLLENAAAAIQHQVAEQEGSVEVAPDLPTLFSDRLALEQIFGNLLDNAVKYCDPDRPLRIRISGRPLVDGRYAVDVEDNGRGIAEQDHERVFELFRRAGNHSKPSEGIGLTHVRTLVRNLGGDIILRSQPGRGSTFSVVLVRDLRNILGSSGK